MAFAETIYTGDGATAGPYTIGFSYIAQGHVKATVDGVTATFTFTTSTTITFDSTPANGTRIRVYRDSSQSARLTVWSVPNVLTDEDLNNDSLQAFYMAQESIDIANAALTLDGSGDYDADTTKIVNVTDPTAAQDAATKAYVDAQVTGAGNVPAPDDPGDDGQTLIAASGSWAWGQLAAAGIAADAVETAKINDLAVTTAKIAASAVTAAKADVASQAEAEAGTSSTKLMTPQRVSQAITALAVGNDDDARYQGILTSLLKSGKSGPSQIVGGWVDAFSNENGIDTATSTDEQYSAELEAYKTQNAFANALNTSLTGNKNGFGGYTFRVVVEAAQFSTSGRGVRLTFESSSTGAGLDVSNCFIGKKAASGNAWDFAEAPIRVTFSGADNFSIGASSTQVSDEIDMELDAASAYVISYNVPAGPDDPAAETTVSNLETYIKVSTTEAGEIAPASYAAAEDQIGLQKIEVRTGTSPDMVLVSNTGTAASAPSDAWVVALYDPIDSVTLNTDLVVAVTRDGGTTWSNVTMTKIGELTDTVDIIAGTVDISGQPSGTSVEARFTVANNKDLTIYGFGIETDQSIAAPSQLTGDSFRSVGVLRGKTLRIEPLSPTAAARGITIPHGMPFEPDGVKMVLECLATDGSYSAGERVLIGWGESPYDATTTNGSFQVEIDGTNIKVYQRASASYGLIENDGTQLNMDETKWALELTPFCFG